MWLILLSGVRILSFIYLRMDISQTWQSLTFLESHFKPREKAFIKDFGEIPGEILLGIIM